MANGNNSTSLVLAVVVSLAVAGTGGYMLGNRLGQPEAKVVATVNGEKITQTELYNEMVKGQGPQVVDRMITNKLVAQEAKKNNVTASEADIKKELDKIKQSVGGEAAYQQALAQNGLTEEQLKESIKLQVLATKILGKDIKTDDAALKKYFEENKAQFDQRKVTASHILVATEAEAKDIKAKLDAGGDFAALAKEKSTDPGSKENGGSLGSFGPGQMVAEFDAVAFSMKKGETSGPVKTQFGYHIIRVSETTGTAPDFEKQKEEVKAAMVDKEVQAKFGEWLSGLKEKAKITNTLEQPKK